MNETITSREELLLAKLAGKSVNISTMTPPVAMNKREKLLLDIATRLDGFATGGNGGGNGEAGVMYVPFTLVPGDNEYGISVSTTTSYADIQTAYQEGKSLVARIIIPGGSGVDSALHAQLNATIFESGSVSTPAAFVFSSIVDFSSDGEPADITLITIAVVGEEEQTISEFGAISLLSSDSYYDANGTLGTNNSDEPTITLDKKAGDLADAISNGKSVRIAASYAGAEMEVVPHISISKAVYNNEETYSLSFVDTAGDIYTTADLTKDDYVVFTRQH